MLELAIIGSKRYYGWLAFLLAVTGGGFLVYLWQLDPAMLEVSDSTVSLSASENELIIETPFVNMPFNAEGLHVALEAPKLYGSQATEEPFILVAETEPLNVNAQ